MANPDLSEILPRLPFFATHGLRVVSAAPGAVTLEMDYDPKFSTPPDLFPAYLLGLIGDVAAVASCFAALPAGHAAATTDFTLKMLAPARGSKIVACGRRLSSGTVNSTGMAEIFVIDGDRETHCAVVLATTRNFPRR